MSAIALYFHQTGCNVAGYDIVRNNNCIKLENAGIQIHYDENIQKVPKEFLNNENTLIIYTPAVPDQHQELLYFRSKGFKITKRARILGMISESKKTLTVAGTHGKTSVSTLCAWIMNNTKKKCTAILGGILKNTDTNLILSTDSECMVFEADEFDRSFLNFNPYINLITGIEPDHLDVYGNYENMQDSYVEFMNLTDNGGALILNYEIFDKVIPRLKTKARVYSYSREKENTDFYATNIRLKNASYKFDLVYFNGKINDLEVFPAGNHNLENAVAAISISILGGAEHNNIRDAISSYKGVKRRFDILINDKNRIYIDDYAHHPGEIEATISALKELFPGKKITGVFQPHLYSRTADFAEGFAKALSSLNELVLMPIYPARELPIDGVKSELIYNLCDCKNKQILNKDQVLKYVENSKPELLITMGAGNIDKLVEPICKIIKSQIY